MKRFLSIILCVLMVLSNVAFAAPTAVTVTESDAEMKAPEAVVEAEAETVLAADPVPTVKPGLNVYTGQQGVWTFEDATEEQLKKGVCSKKHKPC